MYTTSSSVAMRTVYLQSQAYSAIQTDLQETQPLTSLWKGEVCALIVDHTCLRSGVCDSTHAN
jgi:hypothetical protein